MAEDVYEGRVASRARMRMVGGLLGFPGLGWLFAFLVLPIGALAVLAFASDDRYPVRSRREGA